MYLKFTVEVISRKIIRTSYCNSFVLENFERASGKVKDQCVPLLIIGRQEVCRDIHV